jgi:hypothetical protein
MHTTHHFKTRMTQRGITQQLIDLTLLYGEEHPEHQDRTVFGRRLASQLLADKQRQLRAKERQMAADRRELQLLKQLIDKGGVVVVEAGATLITTYNIEG